MDIKVNLKSNNNVLEVYNVMHPNNQIDLTDNVAVARMQTYVEHCIAFGIPVEVMEIVEDVKTRTVIETVKGNNIQKEIKKVTKKNLQKDFVLLHGDILVNKNGKLSKK